MRLTELALFFIMFGVGCQTVSSTAGSGASSVTHAVDKDGFIRDWLILAPMPNANPGEGFEELDHMQLPAEPNLSPKAGDSATAEGVKLTWQRYHSPGYRLDFNAFLKRPKGEPATNVTAYAVAHIFSDENLSGLRAKMGSNDQARLYLNGKLLLEFRQSRPLNEGEMDQDINYRTTLKKGRNTVVFKVVNEGGNWAGCLRFTDKDDKPITSIRVYVP
jgi:hypothetical protein